MRKTSRLLVTTAMTMAVFASLGTPAWAGLGTGTVTGSVTTDGIGACTNGDPLCRKPQNNIRFSGVLITGTFVSNDNTKVYVGSVTVGTSNVVTAKSTTGGTLADDAGVVYRFSVDDAVSATGSRINNGGSSTTGCLGNYQRVGTVVIVTLNCKFSIDSAAINVTTAITILAQFTPTAGDGVTTPVTAANFTGPFVAS